MIKYKCCHCGFLNNKSNDWCINCGNTTLKTSRPLNLTRCAECAECGDVFYMHIQDLVSCQQHKDYEVIEHEK